MEQFWRSLIIFLNEALLMRDQNINVHCELKENFVLAIFP